MIFPYNSVFRKMPTHNMFKFVYDYKASHHFLKDKSVKKKKNTALSSHNYSNDHVMEHCTICQECHVVASDTGLASL